MFTERRFGKLVAVLAAVALILAACGDDDGDVSGDDVEDAAATCAVSFNTDDSVGSFTDLGFSGMTFNVGSKDFPEQILLSNLLIVALEAGGATVTDSTNLGGTQVNREALLAGEIDAYFEYNGTAAAVFLEDDSPSFDPVALSNEVCAEDLAKNDVRWVGRAEANNTFAFATGPGSAFAGGDLDAMMGDLEDDSDAKVCLDVEFANRADGIGLLEAATGKSFPEAQVEIMELGVIYDQTAQGECAFGVINTTDGRISALGLEVVEDPGVFNVYNVSLNLMESTYQKAPEAFEAVADTILANLDNDTMAGLNGQVAIDGENPRDVATAYLTAQGLL